MEVLFTEPFEPEEYHTTSQAMGAGCRSYVVWRSPRFLEALSRAVCLRKGEVIAGLSIEHKGIDVLIERKKTETESG